MRGRLRSPPGTSAARRFRPKFHYELIVCGLRGHMLVGTDVAEIRAEDAAFARELGGSRWYRCLRCDAWVPLPPPVKPARQNLPPRAEIVLPPRGRALRDKIVLRLIAIDRAFHFVVLGGLAILAFILASHRASIDRFVQRVNEFFFGSNAGNGPSHGFAHSVEHLLTLNVHTYRLIGFAAAAYALLEGTEAYGLWRQRRWAEYLTFVATLVFVPYEVYELVDRVTAFRVTAFGINIAIVAYLLYAKRLFGLRGGGKADHAAREADSGWGAFDELTPGAFRD